MLWEQGDRRFESSHPDHLKQGFMAICREPFLFGLALGLAFGVALVIVYQLLDL